MPNWCKNNLRINGNGEKLMEVMELLKNENDEITFSKFMPMPEELKDTTSPVRSEVPKEERERLIEKYGADNWYDWKCENWGCKWDASETGFWKDGDDWMVTFQTPWGPPTKFMKKISEQFKNVEFTLQFADEFEGQYPLGEITFIDGNEYEDCPEEGREDLAAAVWGEEWVESWS